MQCADICVYILCTHYVDENAMQDPPELIYTDRDCCSVTDQPCKTACLFEEWQQLQVSKYNFYVFNMIILIGSFRHMAFHEKNCSWLHF